MGREGAGVMSRLRDLEKLDLHTFDTLEPLAEMADRGTGGDQRGR